MYDLLLAFLSAFLIVYMTMPVVIRLAIDKRLMEVPGERHSHVQPTPAMGGVAIFAGLFIGASLWIYQSESKEISYYLCALFIMFWVGLKDDLLAMSPVNKLIGELFAAGICILFADLRITSLYGTFQIWELPYPVSVVLTLFTIIVVINAFNLIDGINGLSGSLATFICLTFGVWFFLVGQRELAGLSLATAGACAAFLRYNFSPAESFMGDCGSLFLGLLLSILSIRFMELHIEMRGHPYAFPAAPGIVLGLMALPLFDTLRVFTVRMAKGHSPFRPDRNHIHHLILDCGLSHMQTTAVLMSFATLQVLIVFSLRSIGTIPLLALILGSCLLLTATIKAIGKRRKMSAES
jgi:UDP-GlcNAc:undecaprenyl-phosphate/decaprenyl-phosphate GlcNAc-1-phosphate transferase